MNQLAELGLRLDHCLVPGRWGQDDADWGLPEWRGQNNDFGAQETELPFVPGL